MNLDSQSIGPRVGATGFANGAFSNCCETLGDSVGYTTKHLKEMSEPMSVGGCRRTYGVGDHGRKH